MSTETVWRGDEHLEVAISAATYRVRKETAALLVAARTDRWRHADLVEAALTVLLDEVHRLGAQVAAVMVDRERRERAALLRAEDCDVHGQTIRHEGHQAHYFAELAASYDQQRVLWLSVADAIGDALTKSADPALAEPAAAVAKYIEAASRDARSAWDRRHPPTQADCQRAGACEHPPTTPHAACEQLALDFDLLPTPRSNRTQAARTERMREAIA